MFYVELLDTEDEVQSEINKSISEIHKSAQNLSKNTKSLSRDLENLTNSLVASKIISEPIECMKSSDFQSEVDCFAPPEKISEQQYGR